MHDGEQVIPRAWARAVGRSASQEVILDSHGPGALHLSPMTEQEAEKTLRDADLVACYEAPIRDARSLMQSCLAAGVPALMHREACPSPGCAPKFQILVRKEDAPQVTGLLQQSWLESMEREGLPLQPLSAYRAENEEPPCPACGTAAPLVNGACSDCGLQLE